MTTRDIGAYLKGSTQNIDMTQTYTIQLFTGELRETINFYKTKTKTKKPDNENLKNLGKKVPFEMVPS